MENIYMIPVKFMENFEKSIEKLNKKAKKLNLEPIVIENLETVMYLRDERDDYEIPCYKIKVTQGQEIKIQGYKFVGKLEKNVGDTFLYKGSDEVPQSQKEIRICQHCNSNRKRKLLYILKNEQDEYITVGKSCLIDYIGHTDAEKIAKYYQEVNSFFNIDDDTLFLEEHMSIYDEQPDVFSIDQILRASIVSIENRGYYKTDCEDNMSTKDDVYNILFSRKEREAELKEKAMDIPKKEIDEIKEIINNMEPTTSYIENLQLLIRDKFVTYNFLGYAVSMIPTVTREKEKMIVKEKNKKSNYVGDVGEKIELLVSFYREAFYERESRYTGKYETVHIYTFVDENNNHIVWKTTAREHFDVGDKINLKAKVKEHNEYKDIKQTIITRPTYKFLQGNYKSKFLGEICDDIEVEVTCIKSYEIEVADGNFKCKYEFLDKKKNSIIWDTGNKRKGIQVNDKLKLKGTIDDHVKYKGTKQTVLYGKAEFEML